MKIHLSIYRSDPEAPATQAAQKALKLLKLAGLALALALGAGLLTPQPASAADIYVDGADCTLDEAILTANNGSNQPDCVQGDNGGPDTIHLQNDIILTSPVAAVANGRLTLQGYGHTIRRDPGADGDFSVITVNTSGNLTVISTTITGGNDIQGGGFANMGRLTLQGSSITGNMAETGAGIWNGGILTLTNTTVSNNSVIQDGGGIWNSDPTSPMTTTLTLLNSTIQGNLAEERGGGIFFEGCGSYTNCYMTAHIRNSAIVSNTARNEIYGSGNGGGIYFNTGMTSAIIENSTISGNAVITTTGSGYGGGIYNHANALTLRGCTITNNAANAGSGIYNSDHLASTVTLRNSIVARQRAGGDDCSSGARGEIISAGYNLESGTTCGFTAAGDLQNTNPLLLALANGVQVPQGNSPAIDAANPATPGSGGTACATTDQRGTNRADLRCDIGAVEVQLSDTDTISKPINELGTYTFGPTLARVEVTQIGTLSSLSIQHHNGNHPNAIPHMNGRWWGITASGDGFLANLDLPHTIADGDALMCRYLVDDGTWDCARDGATATRVWRNGLSAFSDWSVSNNSPTAVALKGFTIQVPPQKGILGALALTGSVMAAAWLNFWRKRKNNAPV